VLGFLQNKVGKLESVYHQVRKLDPLTNDSTIANMYIGILEKALNNTPIDEIEQQFQTWLTQELAIKDKPAFGISYDDIYKNRNTISINALNMSVQQNEGCTYPDEPEQAAPDWVCGKPVPGVEITAGGYAKKSPAGQEFMKQMAITNAKVQLMQYQEVRVINMVKQYDEPNVAQEPQDKQLSIRVLDTRISNAGGMYVLIGLE